MSFSYLSNAELKSSFSFPKNSDPPTNVLLLLYFSIVSSIYLFRSSKFNFFFCCIGWYVILLIGFGFGIYFFLNMHLNLNKSVFVFFLNKNPPISYVKFCKWSNVGLKVLSWLSLFLFKFLNE